MESASFTRYLNGIARESTVYVVANRTAAVLYVAGSDQKFHFLERLSNAEGALSESQLDSDKPGRGFSSGGGGTIHHSLDGRFVQHEHLAEVFARKIATRLSNARQEKMFGELVLVAEPHFLGLLRMELDPETRALVKQEIGREYAQGSDEEIRAQIMKVS